MDRIRYEKIGGGYTEKPEIVLSTIDLHSIGGMFETIAMDAQGNELDISVSDDESAALAEFERMVEKYAGPLQSALTNAHLMRGHRYTLVYLSDHGFPVCQKITYDSLKLTTYAQHSDVVKMIFTPHRKRSKYSQLFYDCSLMIFDGWQDLDESIIRETVKDSESVRITRMKHPGFSASYIEDLEKAFIAPIMVYKSYRKGKNGKIYA